MANTMDMTRGKPLGLLVSFAVPIFLSSVFQALYSVADSAVVGQFLGVDAFAAVGAAGNVSWMVLDVILGLTQGFGILYAQRFGAHDSPGLRRGIAMSIWLSLGLGALLTLLGILGAKPMLIAIQTPEEILPDTLTYLYWIFGGTLINTAYNVAGKLLAGLGNSRTPLLAVIVSSIFNVLLDLLIVGVLDWGVTGAAFSTVAAQLLSFLICLWKLRSIPEVRLSKEDFRLDKGSLRELVRLGAPLGFRNGVISVGGLFVQWAINGYGTLFVAGTTAAGKYFNLLQLVAGALDGSFATYSAQNYGTKNLARIRQGMRYVTAIALVSSLATAVLTVIFGRTLIQLLVTGDAADLEAVTQVGYENLLITAAGLPVLYMLYLYRSGLQGMGSTFAPTLSGFVELGLRLASVFLLPPFLGRWGIYMANAVGWAGAFLLLCISYYHVYHKRERELGLKQT